MQVTMAIDDDVLAAARQQALRQGTSVDAVISATARKSLRGLESGERSKAGVMLLPLRADGGPVTREDVNRLRDDA